MTDMKQCPFCGNPVRPLEWYSGDCNKPLYCVAGCDKNCPRDFVADTTEELVNGWNTRPLEDALRAENQRLRDVMEDSLDAIFHGDVYKAGTALSKELNIIGAE